MPVKKLAPNLWQFSFSLFGCCVYVLKLKDKNIMFDTSSRINRRFLIKYLKNIDAPPETIDIIIMTHNHFDHVGNLSLFKGMKAKVYAPKEDFPEEEWMIDIKKLKIKEFKLIETPGHTKGSVCIYMPKEKILFSGDTLFHGGIGRTDLPGSIPEKMKESLEKLNDLDIEILCPGHTWP